MTTRSWIRYLFARTASRVPQGPRTPPARFRPRLEALEDRTLLSFAFENATFTYNGARGTASNITFR
jgi:hypothetical protein